MGGAEPSILMLTKSCISKFEEIIAQHGPRHIELENRLADFNLWADGVGALSKPGTSLDSRPKAVNVAGSEASTDECIQNLDSVIGNLALIGVAIRRTGRASRNRRVDRMFKPDDYPEFRTHLECIVLLRPTEEARFHRTETGDYVTGLDSSKLSTLQKRLIDATLRRRHNFNVAQKRSKHQNEAHAQLPTTAVVVATENSLQDGPTSNVQNAVNPQGPRPHLTAKNPKRLAPTISGMSFASTAEGTLQYRPAVNRHNPGAAKTQITSIASNAQFPRPPPIPSGRQVAKCPCCCQSLPIETFTNPKTWKQHVIEDLCPYTCIADNCPTPELLFCTRREWENHVRQSHLPQWQCSFCDEQDGDYPTMESMGNHIHSEHANELLENSLSTLLSWSAVQTMGITACPLCASSGPEDSSELVDHVLQHTYEFALRALPWPQPVLQELNALPGSFKLSGDSENLQNIPQWIDEAFHEEIEAPSLALSDFDRADHSILAPTDVSEYTDHFPANAYFEIPEDTSLRPQSRQSLVSDSLTTPLHSDFTNSNSVPAWSADTKTRLQTLEGHTDAVSSIAFSPDGKTIISGSRDKTIRLWAADTGARLQTLEGHTDSVFSVAFSPDGNTIASGSADKTIRLWAADTGAYLQTLKGHDYSVFSVAFSPDSKTIVSGSADETIRLWAADTGARLQTLEGHTDAVSSVVFSPDSNIIISGSADEKIRLWAADTGVRLQTLKGHTNVIFSVAFSPDGNTVISGSADKTIRLWAADTWAHLQTLEGHTDAVSSIAFSPDGNTIISGSHDKTIRLWSATGIYMKTLRGHTDSVFSVTFSPDGNTIASGSDDSTVRLFRRKDRDSLWKRSFFSKVVHG